VITTKADLGAFVHPALFYSTRQEYLDCLVPFITEGLAAGYPILVAVPEPNLTALRDALGHAATRLTLADMTKAGRNPGRILGGVLSSFADEHQGQSVRMIGEPIWPTRSAIEYPACVQHEALINNAFAGRNVTVLCPYDEAHLDPDVIADARITHPELWRVGSPGQNSPAFGPDVVWAHYNEPLHRSPAAVPYTVRQLADISGARDFAASFGQWFGLSRDGTANLQLITNELATGSLATAGGKCRLAFWHEDGHRVVEARDSGYLDDPLDGRRPYERDTPRGRGLFVVNAVSDLVRIHTAEDETTIRAYLRLEEVA
jgi:anti-sigma regulatory factor (Ser/Thr protein kinase)